MLNATPRMDATEERSEQCGKSCWFKFQAGEKDQGPLVLVLTKAFERVGLPVVWAWATHFNFLRKILRVLCDRGRCSSKDVWRSRCRPSRPSCQDQNGVVDFLRILLQDALSEVTKFYPPLKLRVFLNDITAMLKGRNKELVELAEKVLNNLKEEVEGEGPEMVDHSVWAAWRALLLRLLPQNRSSFRRWWTLGTVSQWREIKACAVCGLRMTAEENTSMSSGSPSPDLRDMWRCCPKSPDWNSDVDSWTESEESSGGTSSDEEYLEVVGQGWSGELVILFLEDWELAREVLSCLLALDLSCQEVQEAWQPRCCCLGRPPSQCLEVSPTLEGLWQYGVEYGGRTLGGELLNFDRRSGRRQ